MVKITLNNYEQEIDKIIDENIIILYDTEELELIDHSFIYNNLYQLLWINDDNYHWHYIESTDVYMIVDNSIKDSIFNILHYSGKYIFVFNDIYEFAFWLNDKYLKIERLKPICYGEE